MAKRLITFPPAVGVSRRRRYPWGEWEDGSVWHLEPGTDFDVPAGAVTADEAVRNIRAILYQRVARSRANGSPRAAVEVHTVTSPDDSAQRPPDVFFRFTGIAQH